METSKRSYIARGSTKLLKTYIDELPLELRRMIWRRLAVATEASRDLSLGSALARFDPKPSLINILGYRHPMLHSRSYGPEYLVELLSTTSLVLYPNYRESSNTQVPEIQQLGPYLKRSIEFLHEVQAFSNIKDIRICLHTCPFLAGRPDGLILSIKEAIAMLASHTHRVRKGRLFLDISYARRPDGVMSLSHWNTDESNIKLNHFRKRKFTFQISGEMGLSRSVDAVRTEIALLKSEYKQRCKHPLANKLLEFKYINPTDVVDCFDHANDFWRYWVAQLEAFNMNILTVLAETQGLKHDYGIDGDKLRAWIEGNLDLQDKTLEPGDDGYMGTRLNQKEHKEQIASRSLKLMDELRRRRGSRVVQDPRFLIGILGFLPV